MEPQADESELRWTDALLMLLVVAGLAFSLLLQAAPQPIAVLEAFNSRLAVFFKFVVDGLEAVLMLAAGLLLELLR